MLCLYFRVMYDKDYNKDNDLLLYFASFRVMYDKDYNKDLVIQHVDDSRLLLDLHVHVYSTLLGGF